MTTVASTERIFGAAPRRDGDDNLWTAARAVTALSFEPPRHPDPKPWHRVPVPAVTSGLKVRNVWKRIGGLSRAARHDAALAELETQGQGARKRARKTGFAGACGDAKWDQRLREVRDGMWDLVEARVSVASVKDQQTAPEQPTHVVSRPCTFPEDGLQWVPRKRHNTRWPIDPPEKSAPMIADLQPLNAFEIPAVDIDMVEEEDVPRPVVGKQKRRRSTRRLSRRLSLAPISESDCEGPELLMSPVKTTICPLAKMSPMRPSPVKVSLSPVKNFTVSAMPQKADLTGVSRQLSSPMKSPSKGTVLFSVPEEEAVVAVFTSHDVESSLALTDTVTPAVFDQPETALLDDEGHESQRRASLSNARHSERRSSSVTRLLPLATSELPSRRYSLLPSATESQSSTTRRHTLDVLGNETQRVRFDITSPDEVTPDSDLVSHPGHRGGVEDDVDAPVDVDVRTNLDIFGQSPVLERSSPKLPNIERDISLEDSPHENLEVNGESAIHDALGINHEVDVVQAAPEQAATGPQAASFNATHQIYSPAASPTVQQRETQHKPRETLAQQADDVSFVDSAPPTPNSNILTNDQDNLQESSPTIAFVSEMLDNPEFSPPDLTRPATALGFNRPIHESSDDLDEDSSSESDESLSEVNADDVSTAIRVEFYEPTVAMNIEEDECCSQDGTPLVTSSPKPNFATDTAQDCLVVTFKIPPETESVASVATGEHPGPSPSNNHKTVPGTPEGGATLPASRGLPSGGEDTVDETPSEASPGFKPINGRQGSSKSPSPTPPEPVGRDEDNTVNLDDLTSPVEEDVTGTVEFEVEAPADDSDTDVLRNFLTRFKADKDAKAAAAHSRLRPKRRSGSTGSTTSSGSPLSRSEARNATPQERLPLGEKDLNKSPSPSKKRKNKEDGDLPKENDRLSKPALDDISPPRPKRRRKRMEAETDSVFSADFQDGQSLTEAAPVRRSTRNRHTRIPLKPTTQTANSTALFSIPVRLPGSAGMAQDGDPMATFNFTARSRNEEKDLAAMTRVNTRKNKGNSVPPRAVLAMQAENPSGWKMRELKSVFDAREALAAQDNPDAASQDGTKTDAAGKGVRWAEVLVRFQGEDGSEIELKKPVLLSSINDNEEEKALLEMEAVVLPQKATVEEAVQETVASAKAKVKEDEKPERKLPARRTRASKLPPPTVRKSLPTPSAATTTSVASTSKVAAPKKATKPASVPKTGTMRMATRRTGISGLGMSGNGTPAPKRKTKTVV